MAKPWQGVIGRWVAEFFEVYEAGLQWDSQLMRIPIDTVDTVPLIGMKLLEGFELTIQIRTNGTVRIVPLP